MLTEQIRAWVVDVFGGDAEIVAVEPTYTWRPGAPLRLQIMHDTHPCVAILRTLPVGRGRNLVAARLVASLTVAEEYDIPAPRMIAADIDGSDAGDPVIIETGLPGSSRIPREASAARLRALGRITGSLCAAEIAPTEDLRLRTGPVDIKNASAERRRALRFERATRTEQAAMVNEFCAAHDCAAALAHHRITTPAGGRSDLLESAEDAIARMRMPSGVSVLVHGDVWQGNVMWVGDQPSGFIDWDASGVGHPGIDLGSARLDAAIMFGVSAAREVHAGWQSASNCPIGPDEVAYWDAKAALHTPANMAIPALSQYGRSDLAFATAAQRRDEFLGNALARMT